MSADSLFEIPDSNSSRPAARASAQFVAPTQAAVPRAGIARIEDAEARQLVSAGLDNKYEFSTGYGMRPRRVDETLLLVESHSGRAKLGVMLAMVAILIVAVVGGAIAFAAAR